MQQLCHVLASGAAHPPRLIALIAAQAVPRPKMLPMEKAEPTLPIEKALPTEPAPADSVFVEAKPMLPTTNGQALIAEPAPAGAGYWAQESPEALEPTVPVKESASRCCTFISRQQSPHCCPKSAIGRFRHPARGTSI